MPCSTEEPSAFCLPWKRQRRAPGVRRNFIPPHLNAQMTYSLLLLISPDSESTSSAPGDLIKNGQALWSCSLRLLLPPLLTLTWWELFFLSSKLQGIFRVWRDTLSLDNPKLISKFSGKWCVWNHIECGEKCHLRCLWGNDLLFARLGSKHQHSINSQERDRGMGVLVLQQASKNNFYH